MSRLDNDGYAADDGRCYDAEGYDVTDAVEHRECHACGGVPSRSAEPLMSCDECGKQCCTACLADGRGMCTTCVQFRDDEQRELEADDDPSIDGCDPVDEFDEFIDGCDDEEVDDAES